jgi:hypothetical protein
MRLLVCGGREFTDVQAAFAALDRLHARNPVSLLIEGGARGADAIARYWADENAIPFVTFQADWDGLGPSAGPLRNIRMLQEGRPDMVAAFPGRRGTAHMVRIAEEAGVHVVRLAADAPAG